MDGTRLTPVILAIDNGSWKHGRDTELLKLLIEHDARLDISEPWNGTDQPPLVRAIEHGRSDIVRTLAKAGADVEQARRYVLERSVRIQDRSQGRTNAYLEALNGLFGILDGRRHAEGTIGDQKSRAGGKMNRDAVHHQPEEGRPRARGWTLAPQLSCRRPFGGGPARGDVPACA